MPARPLPNLLLQAFFDLGEDGWEDEMDLNLLKLSVLVQATVSEKVAEEPADPAAGTIIVLDETNATHPNAIAVFDDGAWVYFTPTEGWLIYNRDTGSYLTYDSTEWALLATGGGGGDIPAGGAARQVMVKQSATDGDVAWEYPTESIIVALGDETTAITVGAGKVTMRMPYAFKLTAVRASLTTASTAGTPTIDINEGGASILSTKLTIDVNEKTSVTAATAPVISDSDLADDAELTFDIDVAGTGAAGLKVVLIGYRK